MNINQSESTVELKPLSPPYFLFGKDADKSSSDQFLLSIYDSGQASIFVVDVLEDGDFRYVALNPTHERWLGMSSEELQGKRPEDILSPMDAAKVRQHYNDCVRFGKTISYEQCLQFQGVPTWWSTTLTPLRDANSRIYRLIGTSSSISPIKQIERKGKLQAEKAQLLADIDQKICQSQDLETILPQIVKEARNLLSCDRVLVYRFQADGTGAIAAEATIVAHGPLMGKNIQDPCFTTKHQERYRKGGIQVIEDIYAAGLHPCQIDFLASLQVRANLVVPILLHQELWGLLIAQYCDKPHQWRDAEIDLLKQLAAQIGIASQQAELQQQLENLQAEMELQRQEYAEQVQKIQDFQALWQRITEQIRDNLDISQILETVVQDLAQLLKSDRCHIELYDIDCTLATIAYEYTHSSPLYQGVSKQVADFPEVYQRLLQKQSLHSVEILPGWQPTLQVITQLAYPIFDRQGMLGNLWLIRASQQPFDEWENGVVQQIASQCAIAIRNSRLNLTIQTQGQEIASIERLNHQFLRALAQELRTPITSINLAAQTLESMLNLEGLSDKDIVPQLLQILHSECGRGSNLIQDLLTLTQHQTPPDPQTLIPIDLQTWLPPIVESFREVTACQKQQLKLKIDTALPTLATEITELERIVTELLNHICKYTPTGETITVSVRLIADMMQISFQNSGLEISAQQRARIFEPFYHIAKNDPWKHSGTGLELALVQKMVTNLGGKIQVESVAGKTTFIVKLPRA
ncbi:MULTISPECIES: sensor histidine kinase [unclassified Tolypothrix]|uniref:sensor histidine kinase n=1 Tax=unclassified Tolypothrix TaxID=2649714 RepID=UPI0005EAC4F7|nr:MULTISPECIES: GAF domain-containing protein [unclassified Tolypothrix]BAY92619.1 multi-sensor signal transduction histidine kinase [Microchaete diplosiphon NIES-3275]EKF05709.1 sensor histidine kinase [Tolypothrix sp. PCC 7601]MBE9084187.1 GAF domain-containing protein [Tolypothrix sp. LEGE 11397]UYD26567.1 GAF domain-containing protein [Tolypothrix sp. PCC 7712]UYD31196.1 GAF domain-containing protein [Tolypothrix sp. PCC 7601]